MTKEHPLKTLPTHWKIAEKPVPYPTALAAMEAHVQAMLAGEAGPLIWLLEHPPLYTAGTSANPAELIEPERFPVYQTGRGGKHTYHGPGQRVVYVMMDLTAMDRDLKAHVWRLEEWVIRVVADFGVRAERREGRIGLWVDVCGTEKKIAAIGVRARRWVTSHGLALNVHPDLKNFGGIVPCGIRDYGVTSLQELGIAAPMSAIDEAFKRHYANVFALTNKKPRQ